MDQRVALFEVALLFDKAAFAGAVRHRLILQRTLAALVADRAIERVVDEQQLKHTILRLLHGVGLGVHDHAFADREHARWLQARAATSVDLDQAHATHTYWRHARVVAESWHVDASVFAGVDQVAAGFGVEDLAIHRDRRAGRNLDDFFFDNLFGRLVGCLFSGVAHADPTGITRRSERLMYASNSSRKRSNADAMGDTACCCRPR